MFSNQIMPKLCFKFYCKNCDYGTSKKSSYDNHLMSAKHSKMAVSNQIMPKLCSKFCCQMCNKTYKDNSGLWRHKKQCKKEEEEKVETKISEEIMLKLIKQNTDLQRILLEQSKEKKVTNIVTTNNFNLNVYLNEECKDALNLVEFVDGLKVTLSDLEETAKIGYTEGVSRIFINGLNELEAKKRPIHCSDGKREVLYIKESNEWSKEDEKKSHLTKAIKKVSNKNIKQIYEWQKKYPNYKDPESKESDRYMEMIYNTMSGSTTEEQESNMNKIIKNITKKTIIDKSMI